MTISAQLNRVLFVHAHPDDESLYTGAVIAQCVADGLEVMVVTCTRGEEGDILDPLLSDASPDKNDNLGEIRIEELSSALSVLGVRQHSFLGAPSRLFRDSGMVGRISNQHPHAFIRADLSEPVDLLAKTIIDFKPHVVVTYDPSGGYGHPDHIQTNFITTKAIETARISARISGIDWQTPTFFWCVIPDAILAEAVVTQENFASVNQFLHRTSSVEPDGEEEPIAVPVSGFIAEKVAALRCHRSQMGPDLFGGLSDAEILALIPKIELLLPSKKL
ncbi:MAG: N-acetyl-1-D-myo-inositol-2-amino-2-deoxy-alpha-D-glucopyranoside deacetylase [Actinomycetes bacterium]